MAENKYSKSARMKMSNGTKRKIQSDMLEFEVKKQEEELKIIKQILTKRSYLNDQYKNKEKTTKRSSLKPISKNDDPHKRLINNIASSKKNELLDNNVSISQKSTESKGWKIDKTLLDDNEFRKSHLKKKERVEISCEENNEHVLSAFNFDLENDQEKNEEFELSFNNLVRRNLKIEYTQISDFLDSINLDKYLSLFIESNIDSIKKIFELNDSTLDLMKIPLGHKLKILKRAQQLKNIQNDEKEEETVNNPSEEISQKEIPVVVNHPNNNFTQRKAQIASKHSIGIGVIPEEMNIIDEDENSNELIKLKNIGQKEFNFMTMFGEDNEELLENDSFNEENIKQDIRNETTIDENHFEVKKDSIPCWQCLTLNEGFKMYKIKEKHFCKEKCLMKYIEKMKINCKNCQIEFFKPEGLYRNLQWFCSKGCAENVEIEEENKLKSEAEDDVEEYDPMTDF